jgi:hypothetical protein
LKKRQSNVFIDQIGSREILMNGQRCDPPAVM